MFLLTGLTGRNYFGNNFDISLQHDPCFRIDKVSNSGTIVLYKIKHRGYLIRGKLMNISRSGVLRVVNQGYLRKSQSLRYAETYKFKGM